MCDSRRCFHHNSDPCDFAVYFTCLSHFKKEVFNRHTQGQDQMALGIFSQGVGIKKKNAIFTSGVFISSKLRFGVGNEICIVN